VHVYLRVRVSLQVLVCVLQKVELENVGVGVCSSFYLSFLVFACAKVSAYGAHLRIPKLPSTVHRTCSNCVALPTLPRRHTQGRAQLRAAP